MWGHIRTSKVFLFVDWFSSISVIIGLCNAFDRVLSIIYVISCKFSYLRVISFKVQVIIHITINFCTILSF